MSGEVDEWDAINRRKYLAALSAASVAGVAGCGGGGDGGDGGDGGTDGGGGGDGGDGADGGGDGGDGGDGGGMEHGERVPTVVMEIIAGIGSSTQFIETGLGILGDTLEEDFGVRTETNSKELGTFWDEVYNDDRSHHLHLDFKGLSPNRLDPQPLLEPEKIQNAGANGRQSLTQFASCEYTRLVEEASKAPNEEERRNIVHEALNVASEAVDRIPLFNQVEYGTYRPSQVDVGDSLGKLGVQIYNTDLWINSESADGSQRTTYTTQTYTASRNHIQTPNTFTLMVWGTLIYTPLIAIDANMELTPFLATDWEITDQFQTYTFNLREDAEFHNGDPITASDVKWTFEYVDAHTDILPDAEPLPYDSIDAVDDHTIEFNFTQPRPTFLRAQVPKWGVLPQDVWVSQGAEDNPRTFTPDPIIGGGPYEVNSFRRNELIDLVPHDGFWDPPADGLTIRAFQDLQSGFRSFQNDEINMMTDIGGTIANQIRNDMDDAEVTVLEGFTDWWLIPQTNFGPTKFREFRMAVSQALKRQEINQVANYGDATPHLYSSILGETHPFYPEDHGDLTKIAESAAGDVDVAKQTLEDAGWTWDDDGNLHYPVDADLEPLWPQGETPMEYPDKWPCVSEMEN